MKEIIIPNEVISNKIYFIRNQKVMLDRDLAALYEVETKRINEQIKRNSARFPENFMFQLNEVEYENLKSKNEISRWGRISIANFYSNFSGTDLTLDYST